MSIVTVIKCYGLKVYMVGHVGRMGGRRSMRSAALRRGCTKFMGTRKKNQLNNSEPRK